MKRIAFLCLLIGLSGVFPVGRCAGQGDVPEKFRDLYAYLNRRLDAFNRTLGQLPSEGPAPVVFSAELLMGNAHRGARMLEPERFQGVVLELDRLKSLGVQAVTVSLGFPVLYPPFHRDQQEYNAYLDFYKRLSREVRSRSLKLIVTSGAIFSKGNFSEDEDRVARFYRGLGFEEYCGGRASVAATIARELAPDFMTVGSEPDTEAEQTGQPMKDPGNFIRLAAQAAQAAKAAGPAGLRVGAGVGTWLGKYEAVVRGLCGLAQIDFIDIHIYPVNMNFLERALVIADRAHAAGKGVAMSEAWLYKTRLSDLGRGFIAPEMFSRDTFSFWEPLDEKFLALACRLARQKRFEFFSPFWTKYFYAYLDYEQARDLGVVQLNRASALKSAQGVLADSFTGVARSYSSCIKEAR